MNILNFNQFINENKDIVLKYYCFDWDDNLLKMPTKINMEHKVDDVWIDNPVSTEHFAEIRGDKENWRLGQNPFIEFRDDGPRGDNGFIEDMKLAIGGAKYPQEPVRMSPSWFKFIECIVSGSIFAIITARGHKAETMRKGVEWIIDNYLTYEQKKDMYNNCLSYNYMFGKSAKFTPGYENISKHALISSWLDHCGYYGVSNPDFINKHKSGGADSPEIGKEIAIKEFISKCANFANELGLSFKAGMSDDDMKNVLHMKSVLSELSKLYKNSELTVFDTSGGNYIKNDVYEDVNNSVIPFSAFSSQNRRFNYEDRANNDNGQLMKFNDDIIGKTSDIDIKMNRLSELVKNKNVDSLIYDWENNDDSELIVNISNDDINVKFEFDIDQLYLTKIIDNRIQYEKQVDTFDIGYDIIERDITNLL